MRFRHTCGGEVAAGACGGIWKQLCVPSASLDSVGGYEGYSGRG